MYSWPKNSDPLSVVMVFIHFRYGSNRCTIILAASVAFLPWGSFLITSQSVLLSIIVTIAPLLFLPTMVSISKSPNLLPSASLGRSWILVRLGIFMRASPTGLCLCFKWCRQFLYRFPPLALSLLIVLYIVSWEIFLPTNAKRPDICLGDHCLVTSSEITSAFISAFTEWLPGHLCLWYVAFDCAVFQLYLLRLPLLRFSSLVIVEGAHPDSCCNVFLGHILLQH